MRQSLLLHCCSSVAFALWQHLPTSSSLIALPLIDQDRHHLQLTPSLAYLQEFASSTLGKMKITPVLIEKVRLMYCLWHSTQQILLYLGGVWCHGSNANGCAVAPAAEHSRARLGTLPYVLHLAMLQLFLLA